MAEATDTQNTPDTQNATDTQQGAPSGEQRRLRLGIVGAGAEGESYARFLGDGRVPNMVLSAVCDVDPARRDIAELHGVPFFDDHLAMLQSGLVDAVVTTLPHYQHPEIAIAALDHGVHALVEKPMAVYTSQARQIVQAAEKHPDLVFGVFFNQRTNPLYRDLKELLDGGELGALRHSSWVITTWWRPQAYYDQSAWRATWGGEGGGVLVNQAPHQLDLWQWLCGPAQRVYARCGFGFRREIAVEDEVNALVDFGDGATGNLITCTHDLAGTDRLEILCDRGKIVVTDSQRVTITRFADDESAISAQMTRDQVREMFKGKYDLGRFVEVEEREYTSVWGAQHCEVLRNFAAAVLDGEQLLAPGADGLAGVALANAIHLSAWTGEEVDVAELDESRYLAELNRRIAAEDGDWPQRS